MPFDAGAVTATLGLDTSGFVKGIITAQSMMQMFPGWVTSFMANPLLGFVNILQDFTGSIQSWIGGVNTMEAQANRLAKSIGVNVEKFSLLGSVLGSGTAGLESAAEVYKFLGKNADDAARGNDAALAAFARVGISADLVKAGLTDLPSLLLSVSDGLKALPEGAQRTGVALDLLGRGGTEYLPKLAQGAQALREAMAHNQSLGLGVNAKEAENASKWVGAMKELDRVWEGFKQTIAEPVRDALLPYLTSLGKWITDNKAFIQETARQIASVVVNSCDAIGTALQWVLPHLESITKAALTLGGALAGAFAGGSLGSFLGPGGAVMGAIGGAVLGGAGGYGLANKLTSGITNNNSFHIAISDAANSQKVKREVGDKIDDAYRSVEGKIRAANLLGGM